MGDYDKYFESCVTLPAVLKLAGFDTPRVVPGIKGVIFSPPATVVFWEDGRKTVVRDEDTPSSWLANIRRHITQRDNDIVRAWKEQGINAAILKRMTGNRHIGVTRKWVESGRCS